MHRFMEQDGDCLTATADKLLKYFGYELEKKRKKG